VERRRSRRRKGRRERRLRKSERRRFGNSRWRPNNGAHWLYNRRFLDERRLFLDRRKGERRQSVQLDVLDLLIVYVVRMRQRLRVLRRRLWPPYKPPRSGL